MNMRIYFFLFLAAVSIFYFTSTVIAADPPPGPPIISSISPTTAVPGQDVTIYGTNLGDSVQINYSSGKVVTVKGVVDSSLTSVNFELPNDLPSGSYTLGVTTDLGIAVSTQTLTIKSGGTSFETITSICAPSLTDLGGLISQIFKWALAILGIAVFLMFLYAGILYLTAAGDTSKNTRARKKMINAVLGAILLIAAYLILYTINPDFVGGVFNLPGLGGVGTSICTCNNGICSNSSVKCQIDADCQQTQQQQGPGAPPDALEKHPDTGDVANAKEELKINGENLMSPCGSFKITNLAAWNMDDGAGILKKSSGHRCEVNGAGYSVDVVIFEDGYAYDVLIGSDVSNTPTWQPIAPIDPARRADPINPEVLKSATLVDYY